MCPLHDASSEPGKLFLEEPDSKYFRIHTSQGLCVKSSALTFVGLRQHGLHIMNRCGCIPDALFTQTGDGQDLVQSPDPTS